jgi:hypothetical protein
VDAVDHRPIPLVKVARAHAPFAARDQGEHAQLKIHGGTCHKAGKLIVRQDCVEAISRNGSVSILPIPSSNS